MGSSQSSGAGDSGSGAKSLYQRMQDKKRGPPLSDADLQRYTGKTRDELRAWAEERPGVGPNQLAGKLAVGDASGLAGAATGAGFGGWGPGAEPDSPDRGMKFPPRPAAKPAAE